MLGIALVTQTQIPACPGLDRTYSFTRQGLLTRHWHFSSPPTHSITYEPREFLNLIALAEKAKGKT